MYCDKDRLIALDTWLITAHIAYVYKYYIYTYIYIYDIKKYVTIKLQITNSKGKKA